MTKALSGRGLLQSFPPQDPLKNVVREAFVQVRAKERQRSIGLIAALFALILIGEFAWDSLGYRKVNHIVSNPQSSPAAVETAEDWFENYTESLFFRHSLMRLLVLRKTEADQQLTRIRVGREELIVADIRNTVDSNDKYAKAMAYLEAFPNGKFRHDISDIVMEYRNLKDSHAWGETEKTANPKVQYEKALAYLDNFPNGRFRQQASDLITGFQNELDWKEFYTEYQDLMNNKRFVQAARILAGRSDNDRQVELNQIRREFPEKTSGLQPARRRLCLP